MRGGLLTKERRLAADFADGARAMFANLRGARIACPYNDSNFDAPRRDAWQHGHDWATAHREAARSMLWLIMGKEPG